MLILSLFVKGLGHVDESVELQSTIIAVQDILPHFSVEYIHVLFLSSFPSSLHTFHFKLCLRHYAYDAQRVIDELLTVDRLPIDLRRAQRLQLSGLSTNQTNDGK